MSSKKTCIKLDHLAFPVKVEQDQTKAGRFTVTYGAQVRQGLDYADAAREFGLCVFHALAVNGELTQPE
jgi:hypothetical protein